MQETWKAVDSYFSDLLVQQDQALIAALQAAEAAGLPAIQVTPCQGKFLAMQAMLLGARSILEVGTLGGYSTIWMARALPVDGRLITLEVNPRHAEIARQNIANAGLDAKVDLRLGGAHQTLEQLTAQSEGPFDLIFLDADKPSLPDYLAWSLKLTRPGSLIIADNVVRKGAVIESDSADAAVQGVRRFNEIVAAEPRLTATALQTVGDKGYDGFVMALVAT